MCDFCTYIVLVTAETRQKHIQNILKRQLENRVLITRIMLFKRNKWKIKQFQVFKRKQCLGARDEGEVLRQRQTWDDEQSSWDLSCYADAHETINKANIFSFCWLLWWFVLFCFKMGFVRPATQYIA